MVLDAVLGFLVLCFFFFLTSGVGGAEEAQTAVSAAVCLEVPGAFLCAGTDVVEALGVDARAEDFGAKTV